MHELTKWLAAFSVVVGIVTLSISPALAHTAFESSDPDDEAQIDDVVSEIRLTFAGEADPVGEGFAALDGNGAVRAPTTVSTDDQLTYLLTFDPPLSGGEVGIRWSVKAPDDHPIDGAFTFTVNAAIPTAAAAGEQPNAQARTTMEEFLSELTQPGGVSLIGGVGRTLVLGGALLAIGGAAFAALVIRGTEDDLAVIVRSIAGGGWLIVTGAFTEWVAQLALNNYGWESIGGGDVVDVTFSSFGIALALKVTGGVMMSRASLTVVAAAGVVDPVYSLHQRAPVGAGTIQANHSDIEASRAGDAALISGDVVWRARGSSRAVPIGAVVVLSAFLFDGHTVSEGNRLLTGVVDIVHVASGAVWAGGLVSMTQIIRHRHNSGKGSRALELAVRFSVIAALALTAAGLAGAALTVIIIERASDIWTTSWGQLLIVKTVLVALAGTVGLYNHRVLIPKLALGEDDGVIAEFRRALSIEAAIIGSVVVATASLVGASSVSSSF